MSRWVWGLILLFGTTLLLASGKSPRPPVKSSTALPETASSPAREPDRRPVRREIQSITEEQIEEEERSLDEDDDGEQDGFRDRFTGSGGSTRDEY